MRHLQPVQIAYISRGDEVEPNTPDDVRKRLSKRYVALTGPVERRGIWPMSDLVAPDQQAALAVWANMEEERRTGGLKRIARRMSVDTRIPASHVLQA